MGFSDKLKSGFNKAAEVTKQAANSVKNDGIIGAAKNAGNKVAEASKESIDKMKSFNAESKSMKAPLEGSIERYGVTYIGGLVQYPKKKSGEIGLNIMPDKFVFTATTTTKDWFEGLEISYDRIKKLEIVERTISNTEMLLSSSSSDMTSMQQKNNIEITYDNDENIETVLRVEMLTGVSIYGQAGKCREFMDKLRQNQILNKFKSNEEKASSAPQQPNQDDPITQLKKLSELKDMGIISEEEFNAKKTELLAKM